METRKHRQPQHSKSPISQGLRKRFHLWWERKKRRPKKSSLKEYVNKDKLHGGEKSETLNIVLVGRSGTGKSATGNTILGRKEFLSELRAQSVTRTCQRGSRNWEGQEVVVVDTPSLLPVTGDGGDPSTIREEVEKGLSFCKGGNTVMVLVLQLGRFTQMEQNAMKVLKTIFGKKVKKHTIVLFTRKEDLGSEKIEDYVRNTDNKALKKLIGKCEYRVCAFNNKETGEAGEAQAQHLLSMANELIKENGGYREKNVGGKLNCFSRKHIRSPKERMVGQAVA